MKNNDKNYNKKKVVIISCMSLVLVIMLIVLIPNIFKESKVNPNKDKETEQALQTNETSEDDTAFVKKEKKELYLMDYEDLVDNQVTWEDIFGVKPDGAEVNDNSSEPGTENPKTSQSKSNKGNKNSDDTKNVGNSNVKQNIVSDEDGVTVIDESPNTIKDESKQNEYEGEENQKPIEFFDVKPSGKQPNGDVPAGGKQDVGTWN